jgi:chromate reductase, NAD(P)H dehydrogenase (quinone)
MITIISATNRKGSNTLKVAQQVQQIFEAEGQAVSLLSLEALNAIDKNETFINIENNILIPTQKFIIVAPEYNGTFPGVLKLLIDISDIKQVWWHKKAMLIGVSTGRAGNLRGLDHLTNALNYIKVNVLPNKIPISSVQTLLNEDGSFNNALTVDTLKAQAKEFINF